MANKYALSEATPANTDDALEGPLRIREIKEAYNERLGRDHLMGGITSPDVIAQGADSADSGYHRRITIREETSAQGNTADTRLNASSTGINHSTTAKMAEVWMEKHSGTNDETSMLFLGTEGTGNQRTVVTTSQEQTLTNKTMTAPILNDATLSGGSGSIDGGASGQREADAEADPVVTAGAAAGKFTTLESTGDTVIGDADTDTLTLKAATNGLSTDEGGTTGANKMYAGIAGEIRMYAGSSEPAGWLFCDGRQLLHTGTGNRSELYDAIGLTYTDTSEFGSSGNKRSSADWFRIPNLCGRIPIGTGTGAGTDGTELGSGALTVRTLGDYGADETHTLTKEESGAGPHYHVLTQTNHDHGIETGSEGYKYVLRRRDDGGSTVASVDTSVGEPDLATSKALVADKATIIASAALDTEEETEAEAITRTETEAETDPVVSVEDVYRTDKTDLNRGVKAASAHTQMQPFVVINYIIKY